MIFEWIVKFFLFDVNSGGQLKVDEFFKANLWKSDSKTYHAGFEIQSFL